MMRCIVGLPAPILSSLKYPDGTGDRSAYSRVDQGRPGNIVAVPVSAGTGTR